VPVTIKEPYQTLTKGSTKRPSAFPLLSTAIFYLKNLSKLSNNGGTSNLGFTEVSNQNEPSKILPSSLLRYKKGAMENASTAAGAEGFKKLLVGDQPDQLLPLKSFS